MLLRLFKISSTFLRPESSLEAMVLFDFPEPEVFRSWKGAVDNSVIDICNDYSPVFGIEPEFVAFRIPEKCYLIVTHLPHANTGLFQFQTGFMVIRRILDVGNIGPNVLGP